MNLLRIGPARPDGRGIIGAGSGGLMFRYLRITVAVSSLVACMLLLALWVRSYSRVGIVTLGLSAGPGYMFGSLKGELSAARFKRREGAVSLGWSAWTNPVDWRRTWEGSPSSEFCGVRYGSFFVAVPHGFIVVPTFILAAALGVRRPFQFSLRALLIAMTIIAAWLGLIVSLI